MHPSEIAFVALTAVIELAALRAFLRRRDRRHRLILVALAAVIAVAGIATVFGYHGLVFENYRSSGEFKRGNIASDWAAFLLPLAMQVGGCIAIWGSSRLPRESP
jgi:hypothetical protein